MNRKKAGFGTNLVPDPILEDLDEMDTEEILNDYREFGESGRKDSNLRPSGPKGFPESSQPLTGVNKSSQTIENITLRDQPGSQPLTKITSVNRRFGTKFGTRLSSKLTAEILRNRDDLLSVRQVAELLKISSATVYSICEAGGLPHVRIKTAIRIERRALVEFIKQQRRTTTKR